MKKINVFLGYMMTLSIAQVLDPVMFQNHYDGDLSLAGISLSLRDEEILEIQSGFNIPLFDPVFVK